MAISDAVQRAWENCLMWGDSEEATARLEAGNGIAVRVEARYVSWDELDLSFSAEGSAPELGMPEGRPYDLGAVLSAGADIAAEASATGRLAFFLKDDGTGCHVLLAETEERLVRELLRVGAVMEESARRASPGLPGFAG